MGAEARAKRERQRLLEKYRLGAHAGREEFDLVLAITGAYDRSPDFAGLKQGLLAVYRRYDELAARLPVEHVRGRVRLKLACAPGCAHCCATAVTVIAPEALVIADYIREKFSADERAGLLRRVAEHERDSDGDAAPMCPLNVGGLCSVYPVRPFNCRKFHSFDLAACYQYFVTDNEAGFIGVIPRDVTRDGGVFWDGLDAGFKALHVDTVDLHLVPALRIALTGEVSFAGLIAGEDVFPGAQYRP